MTREALYFGCLHGRIGHFLHDQRGLTTYDPPKTLPWGYGLLDSGLLRNGKVEDNYTGEVNWTYGGKEERWHAFVWWDNSVDKRGASNSGFYVRGFNVQEKEAAFKFACEAFPEVVKRQAHSLVLK